MAAKSSARVRLFVLLISSLPLISSPSAAQGVLCGDVAACREATLAAIADGRVEDAHDFAWRAVQRGRADDPELMFLLARAQSLSGRPDDALVMVRRLVERGVVTEAATHPDLERMRGRAGWPAVAQLLADRAASAAAPSSSMPAPAPRAEAAAAPPASAVPRASAGAASAGTPDAAATAPPPKPAGNATPARTARAETSAAATAAAATTTTVDEMARFSADAFEAAGVVYDSVSHRFLFGDRFGRKIRVLGEGLDRGVDLVRAESAGFLDVRGLDIDRRRGDLWVVSASPSGDAAVLHRLQLVSGRPLAAIPVPADLLPVRPVDLVVTDVGVVLLLTDDGALLRLAPGQTEVKRVLATAFTEARALTTNRAGDVAYVAHAGGLGRVDLSTGRATPIAPLAHMPTEGIVRLRQRGGALLAVQSTGADSSRLVRLTLAPNGRSVRAMTPFEPALASVPVAPVLLIVGDAAVLVSGTGCAETAHALAPCTRSLTPSADGSPAEIIVRRFTVP